MAINIKNPQVEKLINEVALLAQTTKTSAIRLALLQLKQQLLLRSPQLNRRDRLRLFFEQQVWSSIPQSQLGKRLSKKEEEAILGFGPKGI